MCAEERIDVVPVPGASAVVAALSASGLPTDEFTFGIVAFLVVYLNIICNVTADKDAFPFYF